MSICGFKSLETGVPGWSSGGARRAFSVDRDLAPWATTDTPSWARVCVFYKSRGSPFALFHKALLLSVVSVSPRKLIMLHHFKTYVIICYVDNHNFLWPVSSCVFC